MGEEEQLDIGSIAVAHGLLTPEALKDCREDLRLMHERGMKMSMTDIFLGKELLSREDIIKLRKLRQALTGEGTKLGPFELLAQIGEGGMGTVYKVRDTRTSQFAALKILPAGLAGNPEYIERFKREAEILMSLSHPNIVRALDIGELEYGRTRLPYIAMELEGDTLMKKIERAGTVKEELALDWLADIARALQRAHHDKLVHRDVKPDNIFISDEGHAKLGDFGLARDVAETATRITQTGMFMGSVHYASPEQAEDLKNIDIRSDIYSLGATFYHALTGQVPFEGDSAPSILVMHLSEELPWPGDVNPNVSDAASELVAKMMAKEKKQRFQDPLELLQALDEIRSGPEARPFLSSSALSSVARSSDKRRRVLELTKKRKEKVRRLVERRRQPKWPYTYVVGAAAGVLAFVILLAVIFAGGEEKDREDRVVPEAPVAAPKKPVVQLRREKPRKPKIVAPTETTPPPEVTVPPGAWVLYREPFEGESEWRRPDDRGRGEALQPTRGPGRPGKALRLARLADALHGLGAVRRLRLTARKTAEIAFMYRTEGDASQLTLQLVLGSGGELMTTFGGAAEWKVGRVELGGLYAGRGASLGETNEIREVHFYAGARGAQGECFVDDFVIYEPEESGYEPVLAEGQWKKTDEVSLSGEKAVLTGECWAHLVRPFIDFKVTFLAKRLREGGGGWWASVSLDGNGAGLRVVLRDDGDLHVLQGEKRIAALGPGTVRPEEARLELALRGGLMTVRTPAGQYHEVELGSFTERRLGLRSAPGAKVAFSGVRVRELDPFDRYGDETNETIVNAVAAARRRKGRVSDAMFTIGKALLDELREPRKALVALDTCIAMRPPDTVLAKAFCEKGCALKELDRKEEAMESLDEALRVPGADEKTRRRTRKIYEDILGAPPAPIEAHFLAQGERPREELIADFIAAGRAVRGKVRSDDIEWKTYAVSVRSGRKVRILIEPAGGDLFTARKTCVFDAAVRTKDLWSLRVVLVGRGGKDELSGYLPLPGSRWRILTLKCRELGAKAPFPVERIEFVGEVRPGREGEVRVARVWASEPVKDPTRAFMERLTARLWPLLQRREYGLARFMVGDVETRDPKLRGRITTTRLTVELASRLYDRARLNSAARARGKTMTLGGITGEVTEADFWRLTIAGDLGTRKLEISGMTAKEVIKLFELGSKMAGEEAAAARAAFLAWEGVLDLARREAARSGERKRELDELLSLLDSLSGAR